MTKAKSKSGAGLKSRAVISAGRGKRVALAQAATDTGGKTRTTGSEQSIARILDATMEAVSRQGLRNLSMSDVCRFAGVARGTLYRYFPSKEVLLEHLGQRVRSETEAGIRQAAGNEASGEAALIAVIGFLTQFAGVSKASAMLEVEPLFFIGFLRRHLPHYSQVMADSLARYFDDLEKKLGHKIDRVLCCELILRLQTSYIFMPHPGSRELLVEAVLAELDRFAFGSK